MAEDNAPLTITGLRPRTEGSSSEPVLDAVVSMLRLIPGTDLTVEAGPEVLPGVTESTTLLVRIDSSVSELPDELERVLDDDVSTARIPRSDDRPQHVWRGRPDTSRIGFTVGADQARSWTTEIPVSVRDRARLWQTLSRWEDGRIAVTVAAIDDRWFECSVTLAGNSAPPLGLLAALRDGFPGLTFTPDTPELPDQSSPVVFRCDESEVRLALLLPVGQDYPAGFLAGSPAGVPVSPTTQPRVVGDGLRFGEARTDAQLAVDVRLQDAELLRHVHIVGATGTGKSTLLSSVVHQLAHGENGALVLDPHGSLIDRILAELPASAVDRCIVVRADDLDHPMPLNPLAADDETGVAAAISDINEMFGEMFDPGRTGIVGPRFEDRIAHALRGLTVLRGHRASLLDVPLMLGHKGMRAALGRQLTDPRQKMWWSNDVKGQRGSEYAELVAWVNSKFERFSASPALRAILGSGEDAYDPVGTMDRGEIILVDLAKGQIGQQASRLLGYLLINRFWVAAMNRKSDRRFHVIVDEAHSVMAGSLVNMLSEGRKFGISVMAAHQYLGQLAPDVAKALSGNVGTSIVFRANGPHVAEHVAASGGLISPAMLGNLPMFHSVVTRNAAEDVASTPFTMTVEPRPVTCAAADPAAVRRVTARRTIGLDLSQLDADREYPAPTGGGGPTRSEKPSTGGSFLDQWLEKRQAAAARPPAKAAAEESTVDVASTPPTSSPATPPPSPLTPEDHVQAAQQAADAAAGRFDPEDY